MRSKKTRINARLTVEATDRRTANAQSASLLQNLHISNFGMSGSLPVSTLSILTNPPQSEVFVDNVPVGQSQADGWLTARRFAERKSSFFASATTVFRIGKTDLRFDGKPKQVVAELKSDFQTQTGCNSETRHYDVVRRSDNKPKFTAESVAESFRRSISGHNHKAE